MTETELRAPMNPLTAIDGLENGERVLFACLEAVADGMSRFARSVVRTGAIWTQGGRTRVLDPYRLLRSTHLPQSALASSPDPLGTHFDVGDHLVGCTRTFDAPAVGTLTLFADVPPGLMRAEHLTSWLRQAISGLAVDLVRVEEPAPPLPESGLAIEGVEHAAPGIVASRLRSPALAGDPVDSIVVREALSLAEELSLQREEGARIEGAIVLPVALSPDMTTVIQGVAELRDYKLLGKLVMAGGSDHDLVVGVPSRSLGYRPRSDREATDVVIELRASGEAALRRDEVIHAAFRGGRLFGVCVQSELSAVEVLLLAFLKGRGRNLARLLCRGLLAQSSGGCTVMIGGDAWERGFVIEPPNGCHEPGALELALSMSSVDGALAFDLDGALKGFGCLLDGRATGGESRARGSRFNSAVRYTAARTDALAIVVSADGMVSVIEQGREIYPAHPFRGRTVVGEDGQVDRAVYGLTVLQIVGDSDVDGFRGAS